VSRFGPFGRTYWKKSADILKAVCLGAKAVGLGRPFQYANSVSVVT
jgi:isopentenyl diphosphate isomerase/L-lactate dehydrogenase-like FMN-dependent dehydrogenase